MCQEPVPVPPRSRLESLPVELLQSIFLHCLEFNLPRASINIARALSDPLLYTWLIRFAFSSDNRGSRHGFFTEDYLRPPLDFFALSVSRRCELQSAILDCRWCTLPLIRKCQREYVQRVIARKCQHLILSDEDRQTLSNLDHRFDDLTGCQNTTDLILHGDLILKTHNPLNNNKPGEIAIWFKLGALQIRKHSSGNLYDIFQLPVCRPTGSSSASARMPDKLLRPPWSEDKLEMLTLLSNTAYIDDDTMHSRSGRVLKQVIRSREIGVFERLLGLRVRMAYRTHPMPWPVSRGHFLLALKHAGAQGDPFIRVLVERRWEDVPMYDIGLKDELIKRVGT